MKQVGLTCHPSKLKIKDFIKSLRQLMLVVMARNRCLKIVFVSAAAAAAAEAAEAAVVVSEIRT